MSILSRLKDWTSKHKGKTIALCLVLAIILFFGILNWVNMPRDLGQKLEYIGTQEVGNIFCYDQCPSSSYYFATDMTDNELRTYFKNAQYLPLPATDGTGYLDFMNVHNRGQFALSVSENDPTSPYQHGLRATKKRYIVMITDQDYSVAKQSL